jgi:ubiquitin-protein ligase
MDTLRQRLLRDIAEIQTKPYPNIALNIRDSDITSACLVLTVEGYGHMHMTVNFPADYPLKPPRIQMNSAVKHPNIFGSYICSSILNTTEGYTSAYTLKSIAIQLLSFFSSDRVEQEGGGYSIDLVTYKSLQSYIADTYRCGKCHFGTPGFNPDSFNLRERVTSATSAEISISPFHAALAHDVAVWPTPQESAASHPRSPSGSTPSGSAPPGQGQIFGGNARRHRAKQNTESCAQAAVVAQAPPTPTTTASSSSSVVAMDLVTYSLNNPFSIYIFIFHELSSSIMFH